MNRPSEPSGMEGALLTVKELACALKKNSSYIYAMRAQGFLMPGGTATLGQAKMWLMMFPHFRQRPSRTGRINIRRS